jgi:hypothetical protein
MTHHIRVAIGFKRFTDADVDGLAGNVIAGIPGNKNFPSPPVDIGTLRAAVADFRASVVAATGGGTRATADKKKKREVLADLLRKLALYVEANSDGDVEVLLSSGFRPILRTPTQSPLPKPVIVRMSSPNTGRIAIKVKPIRNARSFEVDCAPVGADGTPGDYRKMGGQTDSRALIISGLTPGSIYSIKVRAVGTTGCTDFSDPVSHMCT